MIDVIHEHALTRCPYCEHEIDRASHVDGHAMPKEGELSICMYCVQVMQFDADLLPHSITPAALQAIYDDQPILAKNIQIVQHTIRRVMARQGRGLQ